MLGGVAAATAGEVEESGFGEFGDVVSHVLGFKIEAGGRERVGESGVGVAGDMGCRDFGEIFKEGFHEIRPQ